MTDLPHPVTATPTLNDDQRAELRERILGVMPEHVDLDDGQSWWECGCNDDGHLSADVRMTSLTGAWDHVVTDHLAPLVESWLADAAQSALAEIELQHGNPPPAPKD